ncbi:MAG: threonine/serine exporter family protein [Methanoregula sp.]|nr:threonine/serine exporter family protein [Methanoregula sp.]
MEPDKRLEMDPPSEGKDNLGYILNAELELGKLLFVAGAPGQRILDSIAFLNEKLHGGHLHIFLGFEALVITMEHGRERRIAMCEYALPVRVNGNAITVISRYLRSLPDGADPARITSDLQSLKIPQSGSPLLAFAALTLFAVIFGFFNHADAWALVIIGIAAGIAGLTRILVFRKGYGYYLAILATTLVATCSAVLLSQVIPTATPLVSLIIPCIIVIPGFQLINGGWEILRNHLNIGIPRLVVFFNVLAIMAVGLLAVLLVYAPGADGAGLQFPPGWTLVVATCMGAFAALCICLVINAPRQTILVCLLCGAAGRLIRTLVVGINGDVALAVFCGTLVISVLALILCQYWQLPVALPLVAASVQFVPGYYIIICLQGMAEIIRYGTAVPFTVVASMISTGLLSLFISAAIIIGTLLPLLILGKDSRWC